MAEHNETILELRSIVKRFPGVVRPRQRVVRPPAGGSACSRWREWRGEVHVDKNLVRAYQKDGGEIFINGKQVEIQSPRHSQDMGIATVYQEFNLIPEMSVAENIFLGRQPTRGRILRRIDRRRMNSEAQRLFSSLKIEINPKRKIRDLGVAEKQMVEIVKAFSVKSRICIFDEPTATLTAEEIEGLFDVIEKFKSEEWGSSTSPIGWRKCSGLPTG